MSVGYTLELPLIEKDCVKASRRCDILLNNDRRYSLPVIAECLSDPVRYGFFAFELFDYTGILKIAKSCMVALSLV